MAETNSYNLGYGGGAQNIPPPSQPHPAPAPAYNPNQSDDHGSPAAGNPYPPPQPQQQSPNVVTANVYMTSVAGIPAVQSTTTTTEVFAVVLDQRPPELPCGGIGLGWFLFILGFFFALSWYIGAGALLCSKYDKREKPGYIACTVAAVIFLFLIIIISASRPVYYTY